MCIIGTILDNFLKIYDSVVVIMDGWEWSDVRGWNVFMGARKAWLMVFAKCERDVLLTLVSSPVDGRLWTCQTSYLWLIVDPCFIVFVERRCPSQLE